MAGEMNYGLLDTRLPMELGGAFMQGEAARNALTAQQLQNQAAQFEMQNALAEQAAYKQAAQGGISAPQALMERGLGGKAAAYVKSTKEAEKLGLEGKKLQNEMLMQTFSNLAFNPSNENITAHLQDKVKEGLISPEEATRYHRQFLNIPVDQRSRMFTMMGTEAKNRMQVEESQRHNRVTEDISRAHLGIAQERLAQEMAGGALTPEAISMAASLYSKTGQLPQLGMGKQAAAARQAILNEATRMGMAGGESASAADVAGNISGARQDYKSQEKAVKDFSTGVQGRSVNSFNTAIDHLSTMDKLSDALANGDIKAINTIGNTIARQTGAPAPTSFDAARQIVADEVIKTIVANGGSMKEREKAAEMFSSANSPAQLKGVINTYKDLMGGQLKSLELQYGNTTGRKDFDKKLTPAAKETLSKLRSSETINIPQGAIDALKSGKGTDEQFDAIFGKGAAAKVKGK